MLTAFPPVGTRVRIQFEDWRRRDLAEAGSRLLCYEDRVGTVVEMLCRGLGKVRLDSDTPDGYPLVKVFEADDLVLFEMEAAA